MAKGQNPLAMYKPSDKPNRMADYSQEALAAMARMQRQSADPAEAAKMQRALAMQSVRDADMASNPQYGMPEGISPYSAPGNPDGSIYGDAMGAGLLQRFGGGQVQSAQPQAPGDQAMIQAQADAMERARLRQASQASPRGKTRASHLARENRDFAVTKGRINSMVMPAELQPFGTRVGSVQNAFANWLTGRPFGSEWY